jgi:hypothetical protein
MNTWVVVTILAVIIVIGTCVYIQHSTSPISNEGNGLYQGPVPEGYDEQYFRETGITKPMENN